MSNRDRFPDAVAKDRSQHRYKKMLGERPPDLSSFKLNPRGTRTLVSVVSDPGRLLEMAPPVEEEDNNPYQPRFLPIVEKVFQEYGLWELTPFQKKAALLCSGETILDDLLAMEPRNVAQHIIQKASPGFHQFIGRFVIAHVLDHTHIHKLGVTVKAQYDTKKPHEWANDLFQTLGADYFRDFDARSLEEFPRRGMTEFTRRFHHKVQQTTPSEFGHELVKRVNTETMTAIGKHFLSELPPTLEQAMGAAIQNRMESKVQETGEAVLRAVLALGLSTDFAKDFGELQVTHYMEDPILEACIERLLEHFEQQNVTEAILLKSLEAYAERQMFDFQHRRITYFGREVLLAQGQKALTTTAHRTLTSFHTHLDAVFFDYLQTKASAVLDKLGGKQKIDLAPLTLLNDPLTPTKAFMIIAQKVPFLGSIVLSLADHPKLSKHVLPIYKNLGESLLQNKLFFKESNPLGK